MIARLLRVMPWRILATQPKPLPAPVPVTVTGEHDLTAELTRILTGI